MVFEQFKHQLPDSDSVETAEWMESLEEIVERSGQKRAQFLLYRLLKRARQMNVGLPPTIQSRYINCLGIRWDCRQQQGYCGKKKRGTRPLFWYYFLHA